MPPHFWLALQWYLALLLFGAVALPLTFAFFRWLPERGYALTKAVGILAVGYLFWFLGSLGLLRNDTPSIWLMLLLVGVVGWVWLGRAQAGELWLWLQRNWRLVLAIELLTALAFAGLAWFRAYNPEILGTEKPMEYMFLNAILRSPTFPPHDAWLAGHAISYYYFGYILVAMLTRLTGLDSAIAFNLGLATVFALTAANSWSVVYNLILLAQRPFPRPAPHVSSASAETPAPLTDAEAVEPSTPESTANPQSSDLAQSPISNLQSPKLTQSPFTNYQLPITSFFPALLAPLFVLIVGNFYGLAFTAYANGLFADASLRLPRYDFNDPLTNEAKPGVRMDAVNVWAWLDLKQMQSPAPAPQPDQPFNWNTGYNWFFGARVVHDKNLVGQETEAIDEVPAFSFILGDMHPHVLGLPFVVLATALALEMLLWAAQGGLAAFLNAPLAALRTQWAEHTPLLPRLAFAALVLGALVFLNTWDFPIYWFITALAIGLGGVWFSGWQTPSHWLRWGLFVGLLAVLSILAYFPFFLTFQSQAGGILPNLVYPTRFQQMVVFFGPVMFGAIGLALWATFKYRAQFDTKLALWVGGGTLLMVILVALTLAFGASLNPEISSMVDRFLDPLDRATAVNLVLQRRLMDSTATLLPALLIALCAGVALGLLRNPQSPISNLQSSGLAQPPLSTFHFQLSTPSPLPILFTLLLLLTGALLALGPEWLYLRDNFGTRMNTIFKFYFQTWTLWALVTAFGAWCIARWTRPIAASVFLIALTLFAVGGLLYTIPSAWSKTGGFTSTPHLDGMQLFADQHPADWAVIQWLRANATDLPVIAEAPGGAYNIEDSRMAMATGFPGVIGWTNHEGQWRGNYYGKVAERPGQLEALYRANDSATIQAILAQYNIEYVYIGSTERAKYRPDGGVFYNAMELVLWVECGVDSNFKQQCTVHPGSDLAQSPDKLSTLQLAPALLFRRHATVAP